jgi:hypothetical protein
MPNVHSSRFHLGQNVLRIRLCKRSLASHFGELGLHTPSALTPSDKQTGAIDDVYRAVSESAGTKQEEGKRIIEDLAKLKYELQHDRQLTYETQRTTEVSR